MTISKLLNHITRVYTCLAIKGKYPDAGGSVPGGENMTFAEVLKATRPGTGANTILCGQKKHGTNYAVP
jgi:hypothetical protein